MLHGTSRTPDRHRPWFGSKGFCACLIEGPFSTSEILDEGNAFAGPHKVVMQWISPVGRKEASGDNRTKQW